MTFELSRRRFLVGAIGLIAAPAVIRVADLMPVRRTMTAEELYLRLLGDFIRRYGPVVEKAICDQILFGTSLIFNRGDYEDFYQGTQVNAKQETGIGWLIQRSDADAGMVEEAKFQARTFKVSE